MLKTKTVRFDTKLANSIHVEFVATDKPSNRLSLGQLERANSICDTVDFNFKLIVILFSAPIAAFGITVVDLLPSVRPAQLHRLANRPTVSP